MHLKSEHKPLQKQFCTYLRLKNTVFCLLGAEPSLEEAATIAASEAQFQQHQEQRIESSDDEGKKTLVKKR